MRPVLFIEVYCKQITPFIAAMNTLKHMDLLRRISLVMVVLVGIVLSMKSIREPDLWWQLRTGELILEKGEIPQTDVFSFSYEDVEWVNVKWGYEVSQALITKLGGPEFLPLLQVIVTILLLLILMRTIFVVGRNMIGENYRPSIGTAMVLLLALVIMEYRMTGRPECVSHLMAAAFIFLFVQHRLKPSRWILLIVPLQILWANLHEAYGMGIVFAIMFTAAAWIEYYWFRNKQWYSGPSVEIPKLMTLATVLCIAAVCINPRGIQLLTHVVEIFSQLGENKFTVELYSFKEVKFWTIRSIIGISFILITTYLYGVKSERAGKVPLSLWKRTINNIGLGYILLLIAMTYLSLSAYRNIPFAIIASTPLLAIAADRWFTAKAESSSNLKYHLVAIGVGLALYMGVVSDLYYKAFNSGEEYGLTVNIKKAPHGAASFIKNHDIEGRAFTDYLSSSYLLWYLQPDFKTYIDLRDLDIYPAVFLKNNFMLYDMPDKVFPLADGDMTFDYIMILNNSLLFKVHRYLLQNQNFDLVYGDALSTVYLRNNESNRSVIEQYGFKAGGQDVFRARSPIVPSGLAKLLTRIFNPFYQAPDDESVNQPEDRVKYYQYLGITPQIAE